MVKRRGDAEELEAHRRLDHDDLVVERRVSTNSLR